MYTFRHMSTVKVAPQNTWTSSFTKTVTTDPANVLTQTEMPETEEYMYLALLCACITLFLYTFRKPA